MSMTAAPTYTTTQVMMTLCGLAAFSPAARPSGETVASQRDRIFMAIRSQLESGVLAAGSHWQIVWLGLTDDRANLAYIALNAPQAMLALVLRGTIGGSPIDTAEDLDVGTLLPFADGGGGNISQGSMEAFTEIVQVVDPATGVSLYDTLLHANNTYLGLLLNAQNQSAPPIPSLTPAVIGLSPAQGPYAGIPVTINGSNFTEDCVVDFGVWPALSTTLLSAQQLLAVAPAGAGIVNVTVTNRYGTSATSLPTNCNVVPQPIVFWQFTYMPPS
jgi:IPT/TIG domain